MTEQKCLKSECRRLRKNALGVIEEGLRQISERLIDDRFWFICFILH